MTRPPPRTTLFPYTTLFRSLAVMELTMPQMDGLSAIRELVHRAVPTRILRSEEHTSELQSPVHLVCRLLLEKKKKSFTSFNHSTSNTTSDGLISVSNIQSLH